MDATRALVGIAAQSLAAISDDVTLAQFRVLVLLDDRGPQTMGALARSLDVRPSTATRICDRLVEKHLIGRGTDGRDRRAVRAHLTVEGNRLVDRAMRRRRRELERVLDRMPAEAQRRLARSLAEFARAAEGDYAEAWELGWSVG